MRRIAVTIITLALPLMLAAQEGSKKLKINDAGFGFGMSSKGQALFYYRGTSPFTLYQAYFAGGFHIEEPTLSVPVYNPFTNRYDYNPQQQYYLQLAIGGRRSMFLGKLAGGFFPYVTAQVGAGGFLADVGSFDSRFKELSLRWAPYIQMGAGAGVHANIAMYRLEAGYLSSIDQIAPGGYPGFSGFYIRFILSSGTRQK